MLEIPRAAQLGRNRVAQGVPVQVQMREKRQVAQIGRNIAAELVVVQVELLAESSGRPGRPGSSPLRRLSYSHTRLRLVRLRRAAGIWPLSRLPPSPSCERSVRLPRAAGIGPLSRLPCSNRSRSLVSLARSMASYLAVHPGRDRAADPVAVQPESREVGQVCRAWREWSWSGFFWSAWPASPGRCRG